MAFKIHAADRLEKEKVSPVTTVGRAIVKITPEVLGMFLTTGELHVKIENGLPDGAIYKDIYPLLGGHSFALVFESSEFDNLKQVGCDLFPEILPRFTHLDNENE